MDIKPNRTDAQKMIMFLQKEGMTLLEIAEAIGVRDKTVFFWKKGVAIPHRVFYSALQQIYVSKIEAKS